MKSTVKLWKFVLIDFMTFQIKSELMPDELQIEINDGPRLHLQRMLDFLDFFVIIILITSDNVMIFSKYYNL